MVHLDLSFYLRYLYCPVLQVYGSSWFSFYNLYFSGETVDGHIALIVLFVGTRTGIRINILTSSWTYMCFSRINLEVELLHICGFFVWRNNSHFTLKQLYFLHLFLPALCECVSPCRPLQLMLQESSQEVRTLRKVLQLV